MIPPNKISCISCICPPGDIYINIRSINGRRTCQPFGIYIYPVGIAFYYPKGDQIVKGSSGASLRFKSWVDLSGLFLVENKEGEVDIYASEGVLSIILQRNESNQGTFGTIGSLTKISPNSKEAKIWGNYIKGTSLERLLGEYLKDGRISIEEPPERVFDEFSRKAMYIDNLPLALFLQTLTEKAHCNRFGNPNENNPFDPSLINPEIIEELKILGIDPSQNVDPSQHVEIVFYSGGEKIIVKSVTNFWSLEPMPFNLKDVVGALELLREPKFYFRPDYFSQIPTGYYPGLTKIFGMREGRCYCTEYNDGKIIPPETYESLGDPVLFSDLNNFLRRYGKREVPFDKLDILQQITE